MRSILLMCCVFGFCSLSVFGQRVVLPEKDAATLSSVSVASTAPVFLVSTVVDETMPNPMISEFLQGQRPLPGLWGSDPFELSGQRFQKQRVDALGLQVLRCSCDVSSWKRRGLLVPVTTGSSMIVDSRVRPELRYLIPAARDWLEGLASSHFKVCETRFLLTSCIRDYQKQKRGYERAQWCLAHPRKCRGRYNVNYAPYEGERASTHLTGAAFDISKCGMDKQELAWMQYTLMLAVLRGEIIVAEEEQQACFHIAVLPHYPLVVTQPLLAIPSVGPSQ